MAEKIMLDVTEKGIVYRDEDGAERFIDFQTCYQNYLKKSLHPDTLQRVKEHNHLNALEMLFYKRQVKAWKEVGAREALADPPYIEFYTEPPTRLMLKDYAEYVKIAAVIRDAGWVTFDLS